MSKCYEKELQNVVFLPILQPGLCRFPLQYFWSVLNRCQLTVLFSIASHGVLSIERFSPLLNINRTGSSILLNITKNLLILILHNVDLQVYQFWHGGDKGPMVGDWRVNRDKIWRGHKKARNVNKMGVKWLFYPLFGQKLAGFVLFLKTIIYI